MMQLRTGAERPETLNPKRLPGAVRDSGRLDRRRSGLILALALLGLGACGGGGAYGASPARPLTDASASSSPQVVLGSAQLMGVSDGRVDGFLGLPYAEPPVGPQRRWMPPLPAAPLTGVFNASQFQSACPQGSMPGGPSDISSNEDCLYLNVYRPAGRTDRASLPVMVWIHGGSGVFGDGSDYDPHAMVKENEIIVVTINYRLGVFGLLPMPTQLSPVVGSASGNFALMDQQLALTWVQHNISAFGGDPSKVTIAGESEGAFDICAQLASPKAAGLFQQAVMESFECSTQKRDNTSAVRVANNVIGNLNCTNPDPSAQVSCLAGQDTDALLTAFGSQSVGPYVDGDILLGIPSKVIAAGNWNEVPVLLGSNNNESGLAVLQDLANANQPDRPTLPVTATVFKKAVQKSFPGNAAAVEAEYQPTQDQYMNSYFLALSGIFTDNPLLPLGCAISPQADTFAAVVPTFRYEFFDPSTPLPDDVAANPKLPAGTTVGAYHSGELQYLFTEKDFSARLTTSQQALSRRMINYWGNFVKRGNPGTGANPWPAYVAGGQNVLVLSPGGDQPSSSFDVEHHCTFWRSLPSASN